MQVCSLRKPYLEELGLCRYHSGRLAVLSLLGSEVVKLWALTLAVKVNEQGGTRRTTSVEPVVFWFLPLVV